MRLPTLLVLAAGMGSRYGGLKQLDPVGPSGETVLDYGVYDALRAGFGRVVFVIRSDFEQQFREQVAAKYAGHVAVDCAHQSLDALPGSYAVPAGRTKPWGTGHAVWCAREHIAEPFAVINADDFYGAESFAQLARFLTSGAVHDEAQVRAAMVGFRLKNTLSENGAVSRGICRVDATGQLQSIEEHTGIHAGQVGSSRDGSRTDANATNRMTSSAARSTTSVEIATAVETGAATAPHYSGEEVVSMNCWGFSPRLFAELDAQLHEFLGAHGAQPKSEFYLPAAVSTLIARGAATVQLLPTSSQWFGVTYREDRPRVVAQLAALVAQGTYPKKLF
ncbi:nucleotidyltransferase [Cephaloticoccus primus]|uniref:Nucleotidyltransferase n=1 Tax=Cephaloticoccus primus TaxID=1548207 RepID=A0A139SLP5_9BACT|nr:sugar phosphate nucleotidyltransferase [Cephaloticoccus primus]KXU35468.1 nucleotidyltransferase [Cephaloticoccus primus]